MLECPNDRTLNITYLEAPLEQVWWSVATPSGSNTYLTYYASTSGVDGSPRIGDRYQLNYGDIMNENEIVACEPMRKIAFSDAYQSMDPDGQMQTYSVQTSYELEQAGSLTKLSLQVKGFEPTTHGQWFRECLEMGWRRSLMNLKSVLELGLDLRTEMFSFPRLGVLNGTVNKEQSIVTGVPQGEGNYLLEVFPNSPAAQAGLRKGDVVRSIGGADTNDYAEFVRVVSGYYGQQAEPGLTFVRNGKEQETTIQFTLDDTFTGLIDIEKTPLEEIRRKREKLAKQRAGSGQRWSNPNEE
ncbi:PDZ domain-containing protein [Marinicrinis sediminis]|uniref:PDZ domain-containing protein n=1 Tax=Marinicrinis sediminis TaxID=1652465 RepID=A0ABW5RFX6_9BACL